MNATYEGLGLNANVNVPISSGDPSLTLGITLTPNNFKKNNINDKLEQISIEQEAMKLDAAYSAYETALRERQLKLEDILWNVKSNQTNYEMYVKVEESMKDYYKKGLVSEKEYSSAQNNTIQAKVKQISGYIDLIIYNNEVTAMFVE